ncbi:Os07g0121900 [Oryza sativa Japonica Group]|nr:Os07g0121900 [Oryza sativa Japonica Group]
MGAVEPRRAATAREGTQGRWCGGGAPGNGGPAGEAEARGSAQGRQRWRGHAWPRRPRSRTWPRAVALVHRLVTDGDPHSTPWWTQLCSDVAVVLAILLDRFFDMEHRQANRRRRPRAVGGLCRRQAHQRQNASMGGQARPAAATRDV